MYSFPYGVLACMTSTITNDTGDNDGLRRNILAYNKLSSDWHNDIPLRVLLKLRGMNNLRMVSLKTNISEDLALHHSDLSHGCFVDLAF